MAYDGTITIGTNLDDKEFDAQILQLERKINDMEKDLQVSISNGEFKEDSEQANELRSKIEKAKNQLVNLRKQKEKYNSTGYTTKGLDSLDVSLGSALKKIGRIVLAVFSVRSAFSALSRASSTLAQYNDEYATNLEYIRYMLAQALAPILEWVLQLVANLMGYINYLSKALFNVTLFSDKSAKNFANARKSTAKMKKDLQTMPFDEMNVLSDTSSSGTSGAIAPSIDPTQLAGDIPDWLQFIVDNKDLILSVISGVTAGLLAWKLGLDGIKALGIGVLIAGVIKLIQDLMKYLKDPSWENFGKLIQDIGLIILGLGLIIGNVPLIVAGAIVLIVGTIVKYWEQIKAFFQKGIDWLRDKSDWVHQMFGDKIGDLYDFIVDTLQDTLNMFDGLFSGIKQIFDGIIKLVKGVFTGDWKTAWEGLKQIVKGVFDSLWAIAKWPLNMIISGLNTLIRGANRIHFDVPDWVPLIGGKKFEINIPQIPKLAKGTILNAPGRGVPVAGGTALAGEAGREAYLPLSDTQLLEELGSTIGKYINLNATIPIYVGNRQIAREIKKINAESDFAFNR